MTPKRLLSGIQPSGELHIGNYLGAIKNWVALQTHYWSFFCIVDHHAITVDYDPSTLESRTLMAAAEYVACGVDPKKSVIFLQSKIPEHTELAWIFNTITPLGELERMTQFKDKALQHHRNVNAGLLTYPLLMAADILLYKPAIVPVGQDQKQHVELTRTIVQKFNKKFSPVFSMPEVYLREGAKIMGLDRPDKKMSKSLGSKNSIALADSPEIIRKKIARAVTDSGTTIDFDPKRPAITNLLRIYQLLTNSTESEAVKKFQKISYNEFKRALSETLISFLRPIQEKRHYLLQHPQQLRDILSDGTKRAQKIASATLQEVKKAMGFLH